MAIAISLALISVALRMTAYEYEKQEIKVTLNARTAEKVPLWHWAAAPASEALDKGRRITAAAAVNYV